jgi:broad specificity phosphatase PhoE
MLAVSRRRALGQQKFDVVFHSNKVRTRETGLVITNAEATLVEVPELWFSGSDEIDRTLDAVYARLGDTSSLRQYDALAGGTIDYCAQEAVSALMMKLHEHRYRNALIVGHTIFLQAICRKLTGCDDPFLDTLLEPCQGFRWEIVGGVRQSDFEIVK